MLKNEEQNAYIGGHLCTAQRWVNDSGSLGGLVCVGAQVHRTVHIAETAVVHEGAKIGAHAVLSDFVSIGCYTVIGPRVSVARHSFVGKSVLIGDGTHIGESVRIENDTRVGKRVSIDLGSRICEDVRIYDGAYVQDGVNIGYSTVIEAGASVQYGVDIGVDAFVGKGATVMTSIGNGVRYEKGDWLISVGPQGSRDAMLTCVWSKKRGLRWWVGCQHGITTDEFISRINLHHLAGSPHRDDYLYLIGGILQHPGLLRAKAAAKRKGKRA
jgi:UDP-3-O-[3-hydroxymyristoyl] glucosamine N-acyltransferase